VKLEATNHHSGPITIYLDDKVLNPYYSLFIHGCLSISDISTGKKLDLGETVSLCYSYDNDDKYYSVDNEESFVALQPWMPFVKEDVPEYLDKVEEGHECNIEIGVGETIR
jgi:hypothetical protein